MDYSKPYFIGETAFHHMGDEAFLEKLVNDIKKVGFNAIKFHLLLDLEDYFIKEHPAYNNLGKWIFDKGTWTKLIKHANDIGLDVFCLCNDKASLEFIIENKPPVHGIELHSTGLCDYHLLQAATKYEGYILLGIGGSDLEEIEYALKYLGNKRDKIVLMHGFQKYPTDYSLINISKMEKLAGLYDLEVGYADHTDPKDKLNHIISCMGIANGFNILEKHFTNSEEERVDFQAAVREDIMNDIFELGNTLYVVTGSGITMSEDEIQYGELGVMKKVMVARNYLPKGKTLTEEDIAFKRTGYRTFVPQTKFEDFLGRSVLHDIDKDTPLTFENIDMDIKNASISQFKQKQQ